MYLRAVDWQMGMKDKINLEGPKLKEKQGLYTCPPEKVGDRPFHCCLEVKEELIKVTPLLFCKLSTLGMWAVSLLHGTFTRRLMDCSALKRVTKGISPRSSMAIFFFPIHSGAVNSLQIVLVGTW